MGLSTLLDFGFTVYEAYDDGLFDEFFDRVGVAYPALNNFDSLPLFDRRYQALNSMASSSLFGRRYPISYPQFRPY
ncbi:hypothetical protein I4U23_014604 [Adineta vaga]|nr:hypothetical protein I4U23_014604 [Adineta vaga]